MVWVKGELLDSLESDALDPSGQLSDAVQAVPFNRLSWFRLLEKHKMADRPIIARVASGGSLMWLFLERTASGAKGLANWYTLAFRPIVAGEPDAECAHAMLVAAAKRLKAARPAIAQITLAPLPSADGSAAILSKSFSKAGWKCFRHQSSTSWTANTAGKSFAEYWAERPGQLRSTFKRKVTKASFSVQIFCEFDADAWSQYEDIYNDSWKSEEGAPAFLRDWAEHEAKLGHLRLGLCRIEGSPVAAQFWTVDHGVAYIHKLSHRESAKSLSPGTILSEAMFRHVIDEDHVSIIDFGTGNDAYKADWMDASTALETLTVFNPLTLGGAIGATRATLSRLVRRRA
jgi:hypothetical protein